MIKEFKIFGERCSGTNFVEKAIMNNLKIKYMERTYGTKHFFGFGQYENSDEILFVCVVRNPIDWLLSLKNNPHHFMAYFYDTWEKFLNSEVRSYNGTEIEGHWFIYDSELSEERNAFTGQRFKNIFELRSMKIKYMTDILPLKVKNYYFVKYEDFMANYRETLDDIKNKFDLEKIHDDYVGVPTYKGNTDINYQPKVYEVDKVIIDEINEKIDWSIENSIGYHR